MSVSSAAARLVLFDIDGTLLRGDGAGRVAMEQTGLDLVGRVFDLSGIDFGGKLDRNIWREVCARNALEHRAEELHEVFRAAYVARFEALFAGGTRSATALPGVLDLVDVLAGRPGLSLGILSGNYPESGSVKLAAAGFAPERFEVGAWGSDADRREDLLPIALERLAEGGPRLTPREVVVLGDTPDDVAVARAHGARCLAVLTGWSTRADLEAAGPDRLVDDVTDTDDVVRWILGG